MVSLSKRFLHPYFIAVTINRRAHQNECVLPCVIDVSTNDHQVVLTLQSYQCSRKILIPRNGTHICAHSPSFNVVTRHVDVTEQI